MPGDNKLTLSPLKGYQRHSWRRSARSLIPMWTEDETEDSFSQSPNDNSGVAGRKGCLRVHSNKLSLQRSYYQTKAPLTPKTVRWSTVHIRLHEYELGDNPAVSTCPPLTIQWEPFKVKTISVDEYEIEERRPRCSTLSEMRLPASERYEMLKNRGYSRSDLEAVRTEIRNVKNERALSSREIFMLEKFGLAGKKTNPWATIRNSWVSQGKRKQLLGWPVPDTEGKGNMTF